MVVSVTPAREADQEVPRPMLFTAEAFGLHPGDPGRGHFYYHNCYVALLITRIRFGIMDDIER